MIRPGVLALILIVLLSFSLGIRINREASILDDAYSQVFVVACPSSRGYGTGWWLNSEGYAVTAYHVVQDCRDPVGVRGSWRSNLTVVAYDPVLDVAVLRAENPPGWAHGLPLASKIGIGDEAFVVGYPVQLYEEVGRDVEKMSEIPRVNRVTITWINPDKQIMEFSPGTDAGNSGGPVVSTELGGVAGIVVYARHGVVSEGFYALRMDALAGFLDRNGIEYEVAGGHGLAWLLGLGLLAGLGFLVISGRVRGVVPWQR